MLFLAQSHWSFPVTDPVLTFAIVMVIILIAPLVMQRFRAPGMIGLILAGILVGPNALHVLEKGEAIDLLGKVGLLYIMFLAGLEIDLNLFRRYRNHSIVFGITTFMIPQTIGTMMAYWLLRFDLASSILLASMFASHTLLSYPIASKLGLGKNRAVTTAVGGTIITDTAALLVLAVIARSTQGSLDAAFWGTLTVSLCAYTAIVWWGLPWLGRWFFRTVPAEGIAHFVFIIASVYLCAFFAEVAGVEAIIGAFLAGLALNRLVPAQSVMMSRLEFAGSWFFIPVFLISVGMLVDPRVLISDAATWKVAAAMTITVIATKFTAAWITRRILGYSAVEGWIIFGLSINQAAATLAAVIVGYNLGFFDEAVVNGAIVKIMITCIIGPWVTQRFGRKLAIQQAEAPEDLALAPKRILVPLRNPEAAPAIMDVAFMVREKQSHEPIYPLAVVQDSDDASSRVAAGERMLNTAVAHAAAADIPAVAVTRLDTNAADGIVRAIRELRASTVVMGWTGVSPTRNFIFGSVLDQLLRRCPQQFVVCRLSQPLQTANRLVLVLPPFAHREIGFPDAVRTVKNLASQSGLQLVLSARKQDIAQMRPLIDKVKPDVRTEEEPVAAIESWLNPQGPTLLDGDIFVLLAARENQISWRPSIDRLPRTLMSRLENANLIVIYPSEEATETLPLLEQRNSRALSLSELFTTDRMLTRIHARDTRELIATILDRLPADDAEIHRSLVADLERTAREAPIEIAPGMLLLHIHTPRVDQPMGFLATLTDGIRFSKMHRDSRAIFVLLTPRSAPPATHLQHLARIAGLLHDPARRDAILDARKPDELASLFADRP